ncbi:uracil-DNA glycosylase family protein [Actinacidiphila guanduensis]|uniref:uracil-DNA glycosylase family protein n=1 Tax=Actinacidiphila guanduensis TaxID=310781 RepID=UPI001C40A26E|nr:uracil-DNA glycosylase family protein [Actinacidiphila guanduensis]
MRQVTAVDTRGFWKMLRALPVPDDAEFLYGPEPDGRLRERNLRRYHELVAATMDARGPRVMMVGEAPGYRGHTISGVPFTSVRQLTARPGLITGAPEGDGFEVPEHPAARWEQSSAIVWRALAAWRGPLPLIWAVYPHHPHEPGHPATNRPPRATEVAAGAPIALSLAEAFGITDFLTVGRKAQGALARAGIQATPLRHPAQGGARAFTEQLAAYNAARGQDR